ncbi:MAG: DUF4330 domain-containing protein [Oscillospiraceae bacterium]|nr:DUF4330 domain-containing protein [Oscillospiraceae bacterium]
MKQKFRLNWIDLLIVLLVAGLVAGTYLKFRGGNSTTASREPQTTITYQVRLTEVRQLTVDAIRVGDTLYDDETDRSVGVIKEIQVEPAKTLLSDPEGELHWADTEDRYDIYITVEAEGTVKDNTYTVNRIYDLSINSFRLFYTKYSIWQGRIWDIL